jgi:NAD(P)-dependent dehydrogenase (short-subunit alcohol dehydrogenase family)
MSINGKVVLVTGAGQGIGRAAALHFATAGASVLITGRRASRVEEAAKDHAHITGLVADAAEPEDAARTISKAIELWGRLDILVNNAGAGAIMPLADITIDKVTNIFAVNVVGPSLLAKAALPHLKKTKGSIINVSSTFGSKPVAGLSHYAASKSALEHLTHCWALELAPFGVRVNAVAVGPTESEALVGMMGLSIEQAEVVKQQEREQIPLGRRGTPEEVAHWLSLLADPAMEWVTGQVVGVDGGLGLT